MSTERLLRVSEAARLAQVTEPTIRYWIAKGRLPVVYWGVFRRIRIRYADLAESIPTLRDAPATSSGASLDDHVPHVVPVRSQE